MLVKAIYCERMKCKGTLIWPAFLIIPVIPVLLGGGNYLSNLGLLNVGVVLPVDPGDAVLRHLFLSAPDWNLLCLFVAV